MKYIIYVIIFFLVLTWIKAIFFPVKVLDNTVQTWFDIVDKTINADNSIYNYEWFKSKYEDIQAMKKQIVNTQSSIDLMKKDLWENRKDWASEDKTEYNRLNTVLLGQKNYIEWLIADYNARSKMANRNIFKDGLIPDFIDGVRFIFK